MDRGVCGRFVLTVVSKHGTVLRKALTGNRGGRCVDAPYSAFPLRPQAPCWVPPPAHQPCRGVPRPFSWRATRPRPPGRRVPRPKPAEGRCHRPFSTPVLHRGQPRPVPAPLVRHTAASATQGSARSDPRKAPFRTPPRIRTCRLTCPDRVFGTRSVDLDCKATLLHEQPDARGPESGQNRCHAYRGQVGR
jgi:hypothetical protein